MFDGPVLAFSFCRGNKKMKKASKKTVKKATVKKVMKKKATTRHKISMAGVTKKAKTAKFRTSEELPIHNTAGDEMPDPSERTGPSKKEVYDVFRKGAK